VKIAYFKKRLAALNFGRFEKEVFSRKKHEKHEQRDLRIRAKKGTKKATPERGGLM
jgi:hypothetical protein